MIKPNSQEMDFEKPQYDITQPNIPSVESKVPSLLISNQNQPEDTLDRNEFGIEKPSVGLEGQDFDMSKEKLPSMNFEEQSEPRLEYEESNIKPDEPELSLQETSFNINTVCAARIRMIKNTTYELVIIYILKKTEWLFRNLIDFFSIF